MARITDLPSSFTTAGVSYDWSVWSQNSLVTICQVPWTPDYKDIVEFDNSKGESTSKYSNIDEYIDNRPTKLTFTNMSYMDLNRPIRLPYGIGELQYYNYIRVVNPAQPGVVDTPRVFYYFIMDINRLAPNTTEVVVQLDVWHTFRNYIKFGNMYVERGHILMCDSKQFNHYGRDYLCQPEGLDIGSEYVNRETWEYSFSGFNNSYDIIVTSTIDITKNFGNVKAPLLSMADSTSAQNMVNGVAIYAMTSTYWPALSSYLKDFPWIAQGIMGIMAIPKGVIDYSKLTQITVSGLKVVNGACYTLNSPKAGGIKDKEVITFKKNWRDSFNKYKYFNRFKKLWTYPYSRIVVTAFNNHQLQLKPELVNGEDFEGIRFVQVVPPNQRVTVVPANYNTMYSYGHDKLVKTVEYPSGIDELANRMPLFDYQTGIYDYPTFVMANDGARLALASQAHSIAWQYNNSEWTQQKAMAAANTASAQATNAIGTSGGLNQIANDARTAQTGISNDAAYRNWQIGAAGGMIGSGLSAVGAAASGNALGAVTSLANGAVNAYTSNLSMHVSNDARSASTGVANAAATASNNMQNAHSAFVRDTNYEYAKYASQGDYQNSIAQINAKVQDLQLTPPSVVGQSGGDAFMLAVYKWVFMARLDTIPDGALGPLCQFWDRYGYAINRWIGWVGVGRSKLNPMSIFTYWKCSEVYLRGYYCPQNYLTTIRGIFEKGVTVWANPDDMGNVDMTHNEPVSIGDYLYE